MWGREAVSYEDLHIYRQSPRGGVQEREPCRLAVVGFILSCSASCLLVGCHSPARGKHQGPNRRCGGWCKRKGGQSPHRFPGARYIRRGVYVTSPRSEKASRCSRAAVDRSRSSLSAGCVARRDSDVSSARHQQQQLSSRCNRSTTTVCGIFILAAKPKIAHPGDIFLCFRVLYTVDQSASISWKNPHPPHSTSNTTLSTR